MGIKRILLAMALAGLLVISPPLQAEEARQEKPAIETSVRLDYLGKYLFRGFVLDDNPVMQATVGLSYQGLMVKGTGNYSLTQGKINEVDPNIEYSREIGQGVNAAVGYSGYHFFEQDVTRGQEVYASLSRQQLLNPSLLVVYSWELGEGWYVEPGISEQVPIGKQKLNLSAKLGYNIHYFRETTGFSHIELKAELPIEVKGVTVYPSVNCSLGMAKEFNNHYYVGLAIGF